MECSRAREIRENYTCYKFVLLCGRCEFLFQFSHTYCISCAKSDSTHRTICCGRFEEEEEEEEEENTSLNLFLNVLRKKKKKKRKKSKKEKKKRKRRKMKKTHRTICL